MIQQRFGRDRVAGLTRHEFLPLATQPKARTCGRGGTSSREGVLWHEWAVALGSCVPPTRLKNRRVIRAYYGWCDRILKSLAPSDSDRARAACSSTPGAATAVHVTCVPVWTS